MKRVKTVNFILCVSCCCLVAQLCLTLCDPTGCSPPDSSLHGILQARILEWVPCPPPRDLPHPGIEPTSPALAGGFFTLSHQGSPYVMCTFPELKFFLMAQGWQKDGLVWPRQEIGLGRSHWRQHINPRLLETAPREPGWSSWTSGDSSQEHELWVRQYAHRRILE